MYDDYMQNLLGMNYSPFSNTYEPYERNSQYFNMTDNYSQYDCPCNQGMPYNSFTRNSIARDIISDIEDYYPEIYKIIYPMIRKACEKNNKPISRDLIEDLTNDIYHHLEAENIINVNVSVNSNNDVNASGSKSENSSREINRSEAVNPESRESRQRNNPIMDLIKILLIRELGGRPGYWRPRPPRPMPPRPPFPHQRPEIPGTPPPSPPRPGMY